jgi:hypothetical protein
LAALWTPSGQGVTTNGGGTTLAMQGMTQASLTLNLTVDLYSMDCALTVDIQAQTGGEQRLHFNPMGTAGDRVKFYAPGGGPRVLAFTNGMDSMPVAAPFTIALVSRNHTLYAGYKKGANWTLLNGTIAAGTGYDATTILLTEENGANGNSGTFKNFNTTKVSLMDLGIP